MSTPQMIASAAEFPKPQPELLVKHEVRELLRFKNVRSVDRAMKKGLPYLKLNGRDVRFRRSDVNAYLESLRVCQRPNGKARK